MKFLISLLLLGMTGFAFATDESSIASDNALVGQATEEVIRNVAPDFKVQKLPIDGIVRITYDTGEVSYMSTDGRFVFEGDFIDLWTGTNIESKDIYAIARWENAGVEPGKIAIPIGHGPQHIQVFVSPDCAICRQLVADISAHDLNRFTFEFILLASSKQGALINERIWCSPDRKKALLDFYVDNKTPAGKSRECIPFALQTAATVARLFKVSSLPTIVDPKHQMVTGSSNELVSYIAEYIK